MAHMVQRAALLLSLALCLLVGCGAPSASRGVDQVPLTGIPQIYVAGFEGLKDAIEAGEDETARGIAAQIRRRLAQHRNPPEAVDQLLLGFERVLMGRALIGGADLWLEIQPRPDSHMGEIWLHGRTAHPGGISLRPGAAILAWQRRTLLPDGRDHLKATTLPLAGIKPVELVQEATAVMRLHAYDRRIPAGALAVNDRWILHLRSGSVDADGGEFPAMNFAVSSAQRVELAPVLPSGSLAPTFLLEAARNPGVSMPALLERTVRILPRDRDAALAALVPLVETWTPEQIARLVPSLRWLSGGSEAGGDPLAWRAWLRAWAAQRATIGTLDILDS